MFCAHKMYQFVATSSDCGRYSCCHERKANLATQCRIHLILHVMTLFRILKDVDSDIGECYADPEPLTGP